MPSALDVVGQLARPVVEVVLNRDGGAGVVLDLDRAMVRVVVEAGALLEAEAALVGVAGAADLLAVGEDHDGAHAA